MNGLAQLVLTHSHMVTQKWLPRKGTRTDTYMYRLANGTRLLIFKLLM